MIRFGIRAKFFASMVLIVTMLTLVFSIVAINRATTALIEVEKEKGIGSALTLAIESELGVFTESEEIIQEVISIFERDKDFFFASVFDADGKLLARDNKNNFNQSTFEYGGSDQLKKEGDYIYIDRTDDDLPHLLFVTPVVSGSSVEEMLLGGDEELFANGDNAEVTVIGYVVYSLHTKGVDHSVTQLTVSILTIFSLFLLATFVLTYLLTRRITGPIENLAEVANAVAKGDFSLKYQLAIDDEVGDLANSFNHMLEAIKERNSKLNQAKDELEQKVETRTAELKVLNRELTRSLTELKQTQDQLVQSGKMAALGELVAGVAHEINTPLGIGVTAASHLDSKVRDFVTHYEKEELTREDFEKFIGMSMETSNMILTNLNRAADMVRSFKQVAVDQSDEDMRDFNIATYLGEVVKSLRPKLRSANHNIEIECDDHIVVYGYPGALYQVVSNLIVNSLTHGFEALDRPGNIFISVTTENHVIKLCYKDDGKGIEAKHIDRIFDPFFTTRRSSGGTGLGLHIIYNIVSQKLGGSIRVESTVGEGVTFYVEFPATVKIAQPS